MHRDEFVQKSGSQIVDPAVNFWPRLALPRAPDDGSLGQGARLSANIDLDQAVPPALLIRNGIDLLAVYPVQIPERLQPQINGANTARGHGALDTAAVVVSANNDVLDVQCFYGVLHHTEHVDVGGHYDVCDIAVDEELARFCAGDFLRRHAGIGTANTQELWSLCLQGR